MKLIEITTKQIDDKRSEILSASTYKISFTSKKIGGVHIAPLRREIFDGYAMDTTAPYLDRCLRLPFEKAYSANQETKMRAEIKLRASERLQAIDSFIFEREDQKEQFKKILTLLAELS